MIYLSAFEVYWEKSKRKRKVKGLYAYPAHQAKHSTGSAQLLDRAGDRGDVEGVVALVRLRAGKANPAETVST